QRHLGCAMSKTRVPPTNSNFSTRHPIFDTHRLIGAQALRRGVRRVRTPQIDCIGAPPQPEGLDDVRCSRYDYARRLGFEEPEAALIAHRAEIDIQLLEWLIRRGCSPYLALEIA